jgi:death-on-curing protein
MRVRAFEWRTDLGTAFEWAARESGTGAMQMSVSGKTTLMELNTAERLARRRLHISSTRVSGIRLRYNQFQGLHGLLAAAHRRFGQQMQPQTLSVEDVLRIHEYLVADFATSGDPIRPPGVRSMALLESAVGRQFVGSQGMWKYPRPIDNAATLAYGICCGHVFHNGNKRCAVVAMLVHLDRNRLSLFEVGQNDLYSMILDVAQHALGLSESQRLKKLRRNSDDEVRAISHWISKHADKITRGEKPITYRQLRTVLKTFDYLMEDPKDNAIDVVRYVIKRTGLLRRETRVRQHITTIPFPGDGKIVPLRVFKFVRRVCNLSEENGIDSTAFYDDTVVIDAFINRYRTILRRLARK